MKPHNPIDHVVIIVKENHSFDNYFGTFPGANGANLAAAQDPPARGDPPHDHTAWLERARHAVKEQENAKLTWATYGDPGFSYFKKIVELKGSKNILPWTKFDTDAATGKLPNVSWVYAPGSPVELSEHPPFGK